MKAREYYETGLVDEFATPINEDDEVRIIAVGGRQWNGIVVFKEGQFQVEYSDKSLDPLWEVAHVCTVTKYYNHANFNDVLKTKIRSLKEEAEGMHKAIKGLQLDLINTINEQSKENSQL